MSEEFNFGAPEGGESNESTSSGSEKSLEAYQEEERQLRAAVKDTRKQSFANMAQAQYLVVLLKCVDNDEIIGDIVALTRVGIDARNLLQMIYPFIFERIDDETIKREFSPHQYDTQTISGFSQSIKSFVQTIPQQIFSAQNFYQGVVKYIFDIACNYNIENLGDDKAAMQKTIGTPKHDEYKQKLQSTIDQIFAIIFG